MKNLILLFLFFFFALTANSQEYANLNWSYSPNLEDIGTANMIKYDIDQDSVDEVIYSSARSSRSNLKVLDYENGKYQSTTFSSNANNFLSRISWMDLYDATGNDTMQLFVAQLDHTISIFDLNTYSVVQTIELNDYPDKFLMADINNDDTLEIITANLYEHFVHVYDIEGNELFVQSLPNLTDIAVGDVDNDGVLELVASNHNGYVFSLEDFSIEWILNGGFGKKLLTWDFDGSGKDIIIATGDYHLVKGIDAESQSVIWEYDNIWSDFASIDIVDIEGDGIFEFLATSSSHEEAVQCHDLLTFDFKWTLDPLDYGVSDVIVTDIDNDQNLEVIYGCGYIASGPDLLVATEINAYQEEYISLNQEGDIYYDLDDITGDGISDYLIASEESDELSYEGSAILVDGANKMTIGRPLIYDEGERIEDVALYRQNDKPYAILVFNNRITIYDIEAQKFILEGFGTPFQISMANVAYLENFNESPHLVLGGNNGRVSFYSIEGNTLTEVWSTFATSSPVNDYVIRQLDADDSKEIGVLSAGYIWVYDLTTHQLEQQIEVHAATFSSFDIADINKDGNLDLLYNNNDYKVTIRDLVEDTTHTFDFVANRFGKIIAENIDLDPQLEIIVLEDRSIYVYDDDYSLIYTSPEITNLLNTIVPAAQMELIDYNQDGYKDIILSGPYGVFEFSFAQPYSDTESPKIRNYTPKTSQDFLGINTPIIIEFTEPMDASTLSSYLTILDDQNNPQLFNYSDIGDGKTFKITPVSSWTSNTSLNITLTNQIKDIAGNPLDGNANDIQEAEDSYSWAIQIGPSTDEIGPVFIDLDYLEKVIKGPSRFIKGKIIDSPTANLSPIAYAEYFIDSVGTFGSGVSVKTVDKFYDESEEEFEIELATLPLSDGSHTIYLVAQDIAGNWGELSTINFIVEDVKPSSWTLPGFDPLNSAANPNASFNTPFALKHKFLESEVAVKVNRAIIVNDLLVYTYKDVEELNHVVCRNIKSGAVLWSHTFSLDYQHISPPTSGHGRVYVQITGEGHSVHCFDLTTGERYWEEPTHHNVTLTNGPIIYGDFVYALNKVSNANGIYYFKFNAFTGENDRKLFTNIGEEFFMDPAFYNDSLFIFKNRLGIFDPNTGQRVYLSYNGQLPDFFLGNTNSGGTRTILDTLNRQVIITTPEEIIGFSIDNYQINWSISVENEFYKRLHVSLFDNKIYFTTRTELREHNATTGEMLWNYTVSDHGSAVYFPVVNPNVVVFPTEESTFLVDRNSHELISIIPNVTGPCILGDKYLVISNQQEYTLNIYEYDQDLGAIFGNMEVLNSIDCFGDSTGTLKTTIYSNTGNLTFDWNTNNPADTTNIISNLVAGNYTLTVTDNQANQGIFSIELSQPDEIIINDVSTDADIGENNGVAKVFVTGGTLPYTYNWLELPNQASSTVSNLAPGNYEVEITDANGCIANKTVNVGTFLTTTTSESLDSLKTDDCFTDSPPSEEREFIQIEKRTKIKIFPNISSGQIKVQSEQTLNEVSIYLLNMNGQILQTWSRNRWQDEILDLSYLPKGGYLMRIKSETIQQVEKISLY